MRRARGRKAVSPHRARAGHRGRGQDRRLRKARAGSRRSRGRHRGRRHRRAAGRAGRATRRRRARSRAAGPRWPDGARAAAERAAGRAGGDPLGPCRAGDEAARLRARRDGLPDQAVLGRRAGRARPDPAAARRARTGRSAPRRSAGARPDPAPGAARGCDVRSLGPRVQAAALPADTRRQRGHTRAAARRRLGHRLRSPHVVAAPASASRSRWRWSRSRRRPRQRPRRVRRRPRLRSRSLRGATVRATRWPAAARSRTRCRGPSRARRRWRSRTIRSSSGGPVRRRCG